MSYPISTTTTGTTSFNLNVNDLVEEAFERCGSQLRTGYDLRTARRSLNLLTIEWANRGINLWTVEEGAIPMVTGQVAYPVPIDTIDLLDHVIRQYQGNTSNQTDINISRISESTYSTLPNKLTQGRPIQVWFNRQSGNVNATSVTVSSAVLSTDTVINVTTTTPLASSGFINLDNETIYYSNVNYGTQLQNCFRGQNGTTAADHSVGTLVYQNWLPNINVWPAPNAGGGYVFVYWRMRRVQDSGNGIEIQDIPFRFIPAMVAGLSYYLSMKIPGTDPNRIVGLKADYEQQYDLAAQEDRETAPVRFVPRNMFYVR